MGRVRLGMTRAEARKAMTPVAPEVIVRFPGKPPVDSYHDGGLQVFFDPADRVCFIEASKNAVVNVEYGGMNVFSVRAEELVRRFGLEAAVDEKDPELGYSYSYPSLGVSLWRPTIPEHDLDQEGRFFMTVAVAPPST